MFSYISWCVLIIIQVLKEGGGLIFEQLCLDSFHLIPVCLHQGA